jgi:hypothetical protein
MPGIIPDKKKPEKIKYKQRRFFKKSALFVFFVAGYALSIA